MNNYLKIISLGGFGNVTKNMYVYETEKDIIIVDCGVGFPEEEMLGVDLVIPDIAYLLAKKEKLRAIFISHGHDDHIGALPYVLPQLPEHLPIFAPKWAKAFSWASTTNRVVTGWSVNQMCFCRLLESTMIIK